jgi:hypothetical protein
MCRMDARHHRKLPEAVVEFLDVRHPHARMVRTPVRVSYLCGSVCEIEPVALARLVGWSVTLKELALRMRCSRCGRKASVIVALQGPGRGE